MRCALLGVVVAVLALPAGIQGQSTYNWMVSRCRRTSRSMSTPTAWTTHGRW